MICPYCGQENPDTLDVCELCGGSLLAASKEPVMDAYPPAQSLSSLEPPVRPELSQTEQLSPYPPPETTHAVPFQPPVQPPGGKPRNRIWWLVGCLVIVFIIVICGAIAWGLYNLTNRFSFRNPATPESSLIQVPGSTSLPSIVQNPRGITAAPGLLFSDDFSDTGSGWDRVDEADYLTDYYQDAYRITINSDQSDSWANPDDNVFGDVIVEVDATKNAGPDDNDFGIICRYQGMDQFYYAVISSDGYFGITKVTPDSSLLLGRDSLEFSDAINQGVTDNHIRLECTGNQLTLSVNGTQIDQQNDDEYTSGNVGLIAGTYETPGTDILFDNFIVFQP